MSNIPVARTERLRVARPESDNREWWWIYSHETEEWAGLRIAIFLVGIGDQGEKAYWTFMITGEWDQRRIGLRHWPSVSEREGWVMVKQIEVPSEDEIRAALPSRRYQRGM